MLRSLYRLAVVALCVTSVVIVLGAYTRLTHAGLGCPDWPGCYGFLSVPTADADIAKAEQAFPDSPVEAHKAWNEMIHRYFAGALGLLILGIFILSVKAKQKLLLPSILLFTVTIQAILGMLTVTMNLMPLVVMGHLLGGFTTFCILFLLTLQLRRKLYPAWLENWRFSTSVTLHKAIKTTAFVVVLQIALGGWTAANYSAVACLDLPICEAGWQQRFDLAKALSVPTGHQTYEYGVFPYEARMTIHILHRFGAIAVTFMSLLLIFLLLKRDVVANRNSAMIISGLLVTQIGLGLSNVIFHLPLGIAVMHNFIAVCLLLSLVGTWYLSSFKLRRPTIEQGINPEDLNTKHANSQNLDAKKVNQTQVQGA